MMPIPNHTTVRNSSYALLQEVRAFVLFDIDLKVFEIVTSLFLLVHENSEPEKWLTQ